MSKLEIKILAGVIIFCVVIVTLVIKISSSISEDMDQLKIKTSKRVEMIEKVKNDCKLVHKVIGLASTDSTYRCDDGVEYTFAEWL